MAEFPNFKGSWPWPWPESYCIPSCISHRPLLHTEFHWNRRNFLWTATYLQLQSHVTQRLVTLTLDRVILHTEMHHSSPSTYIPNFIDVVETFCGRTDVRADRHFRPTVIGWLGGVDPKISLIWGLTVDSSQLTFAPISKSRDTKTGPNIKNPAWLNLDIVL